MLPSAIPTLEHPAGVSFAITDIGTGEAVGQIGLWTTDLGSGRTSTGYWVAREFRRHGYARVALDLLTQWAGWPRRSATSVRLLRS